MALDWSVTYKTCSEKQGIRKEEPKWQQMKAWKWIPIAVDEGDGCILAPMRRWAFGEGAEGVLTRRGRKKQRREAEEQMVYSNLELEMNL